MLLSKTFTDPWGPDEKRTNKLMFIGKNIKPDELRQGFNNCLATDTNKQKWLEGMRFGVGDVVECRTGPTEAVAKPMSSWLKRQLDAVKERGKFDPSHPPSIVL